MLSYKVGDKDKCINPKCLTRGLNTLPEAAVKIFQRKCYKNTKIKSLISTRPQTNVPNSKE